MLKKKKNKKRIVIFLSLISFIIVAILAGLFINKKLNSPLVNNNTVHKTKIKNPSPEETESAIDNFFPKKINLEKVYSQIRIKAGQAYFKEKLVSLVFNEIIKNGSFVNGNLTYWYDFDDTKRVFTITFQWQSSSGETQTKVYRIEILI